MNTIRKTDIMKINTSPKNFVNSITGLSALTAVSLILLKRFDLAGAVLAALTLGSVGVAWDRYSTKSGAPLAVSSFQMKRLPDEEELVFIVTHAPYAVLALISFWANKRFKSS